MANSVRKICTRIGHGHQYLLSAAKPSSAAYGSGHCVPEAAVHPPQCSTRTQVEKKLKFECAGHAFPHQSPRPVYFAPQSIPANNRRSVAAAVQWLHKHDARHAVDTCENAAVSPLTSLNTVVTKPDGPLKSHSGGDHSTSEPKGLPSAEQLNYIYEKLGEDLPLMFKQNINFSLYHPKLVFENNIRGTKSIGLEYFMSTISILRLMGHIKYAYVKFDILKITKHPEDGTVKIRWRIKGISGMKVFLKFWKFKLWNLEQVIKENVESWHDGFSIFSVGSDGLIYKITADKMQPDNDPVIESKNPLATTKLALFLGLTPYLNNLGCLVTCDSEQTNELFQMVMMSLEDVI